MKKQILLLITIIVFCGFYSCDKDNSDITSGESYLEITVNGKKYDANNGGIIGYSVEMCDEKPGFYMGVGAIETSEFYFDYYLKHYENLADFETVEPHSNIIKSDLFSRACNFAAVADFDDKTQNDIDTRLKSIMYENNVTNIKRLDETSSQVNYSIKGDFSCVFVNESDEEITVTGNYNVVTYVLK